MVRLLRVDILENNEQAGKDEQRRGDDFSQPLFLTGEKLRVGGFAMFVNVSRYDNVHSLSYSLRHRKLNGDAIFHIRLIGQSQRLDLGDR